MQRPVLHFSHANGFPAPCYAQMLGPLARRWRIGWIEAIRAWAKGQRKLGMAEVRKLSLDAHAAAREAGTDAATFAARAAGQAVATWHVPTHAAGAPAYAAKAVAAAEGRQPGKLKR